MAKIPMGQVYGALWHSDPVRIARSEGRPTVTITFRQFETALRANDLIAMKQTIRSKWDSAISSEIMEGTVGRYNSAKVLLVKLAAAVREDYTPRDMCVYMCVSDGLNTSSNGGRAA